MFEIKKTLIVVYKDEMLINQLRKLVESKQPKDDSINIVSWTEKIWAANKKAGNIKDKVLFLGDIKGTDKLNPVIDVKFSNYGVTFGWAGNQAVIYTDIEAISDKVVYRAFLEELSLLNVPTIIKRSNNQKDSEGNDQLEEDTTKDEDYNDVVKDETIKKIPVFLSKAKEVIELSVVAVEKVGSKASVKIEDVFRDKKLITQQMLFYGVEHFYKDGLEEFMKN